MKNKEKQKNRLVFFSHGISMLFGVSFGMTLTLGYFYAKKALDYDLIKILIVHIIVIVIVAVFLRLYSISIWNKNKK